ncbi:MAG: YbaB/EbfC family nucleoid-associated protein [bacterium]
MIFGNLGDMAGMMKKAMEMQKTMKRIKDELSRARYEAEVNGSRVIVNGEMEVLEMHAGDNLSIKDVKEAANKALKKAKEDAANKLGDVTGGMNIPGLTG